MNNTLINDGGPYHPRPESLQPGASLRDEFAKAALIGLLSKGMAWGEAAVEEAYRHADLMLKERTRICS